MQRERNGRLTHIALSRVNKNSITLLHISANNKCVVSSGVRKRDWRRFAKTPGFRDGPGEALVGGYVGGESLEQFEQLSL